MEAPAADGLWSSDEPGALSLKESLEQAGKDEQDEWEYEYSSTETETYYLTVELSYPEFKNPVGKVYHRSRGGYYKNWSDGGPSTAQTETAAAHAQPDDDDENDDEPGAEPEAEAEDYDDMMHNVDPALRDNGKGVDEGDHGPQRRQEKGKGTETAEKPQEDELVRDIQILDLHSHNPILSYRGRVFEGQWAEVIGTEAIMANHEEGRELPALRNLPGGVDLLAASASRILTTEKTLEPKVPEEDALAPIREEWNIRIPVGKDKSGEKRQQTEFLENLIALKKKKGETDQVTVWTLDGEGKDFRDDKGPDYKPRPRRNRGDMPAKERGRRARRAIGRPRGSRARRGRRARNTALWPLGGETRPAKDADSLSTPTPKQWGDLPKEGGSMAGEDEDDEEDDEGGDDSADASDGSGESGDDEEDVAMSD